MACLPNIQTIQSLDFSAVTDNSNWSTTSANPVLTIGGALILNPSAADSTFTRILGIPDPTNNRVRIQCGFVLNATLFAGPSDVQVEFDLLVGGNVIANGCAEFAQVSNQLYSFLLDRTFEIEPGAITTDISLRITVPAGWEYQLELSDLLVEDFNFCADNVRSYFIIDELFERSIPAVSAAVRLLSWEVDGVETLTPAFFLENNIYGGNPQALWNFAQAELDGGNRISDNVTPNTFNFFLDEWGMDFANVPGNFFGGKTTGTISGSDYGSAIEQIGVDRPQILNGNLETKLGAFFIDLNYEESFDIIMDVVISQTSANPLSDPSYYRRYSIRFDKDTCQRSFTYIDQLNPSGSVDQSFNGFLAGLTDQRVDLAVIDCGEVYAPGIPGSVTFEITLGTAIGDTGFIYNSFGIPKRFIMNYDGTDYDTGYVGLDAYDADLLAAGVLPGDINTTPGGNGSGSITFNKPNASPTFALVTVENALQNAGWNVEGICPAPFVPNTPPTVTLTAANSPIIPGGIAQLLVSFTVDPAGSVASWVMDFGDGSPLVNGTGDPPTSFNHVYASAGSYTAQITITDNQGLIAVDTDIVSVVAQALRIGQQFENNCQTCLSFQVNVPAGEIYTLIVTSAFASPAGYASTFCDDGGTIIAADDPGSALTPGQYDFNVGIDAAQAGNVNLNSTIIIQVKDGVNTLDIFTLNRTHGNQIC